VTAWWRLGRPQTLRVAGEPSSATGASSFHLWWDVPYGRRLVAVSAVFELLEPPQVDRLYFWAVQVSFVKPSGGGAHLGLQHHPGFPGRRAVNWGGYDPEGGLLTGAPSPLVSTPGDANTRDLLWVDGRRYRLGVSRSPDPAPEGLFAWRGTVVDLETGEETIVRDLWSLGEYLRGPVVWTEAFARCDDPPVAVQWSDLRVVDEEERELPVRIVTVDYQRHQAGGCDNTNVVVSGAGWVQRTNTVRTAPAGRRLTLPGPG